MALLSDADSQSFLVLVQQQDSFYSAADGRNHILAAGRTSIRVKRTSVTWVKSLINGGILLSTCMRPSVRGNKSYMKCKSNRDATPISMLLLQKLALMQLLLPPTKVQFQQGQQPGHRQNQGSFHQLPLGYPIQQQPLASRALPQLTPCSSTACRSPLAPMAAGGMSSTSSPVSPHAVQLHVG